MSSIPHRRIDAPAGGFRVELPCAPLLESWERSDHPSQMRLARYRETIAALAAPVLLQLEPPLALCFHVAGRPDVAAGCNLDNFLTPVVKALGGGTTFSVVWATRGLASESAALTLLRAADTRFDMRADHISTRISVSATSTTWKYAVAAAVNRQASAEGQGPIELGIRFRVSPARNWVTLWKPAIDALGGVLGEGDRAWHPRDDRISLLVLERELEPELGWDIELDVRWAEC